mmetsp:Transcript_18495/g.60703  ORF Transcript_18495/g.60703 Transcript_18495/m.60703 type:complete len:407 (-) Transcript_18495:101-1321(-)
MHVRHKSEEKILQSLWEVDLVWVSSMVICQPEEKLSVLVVGQTGVKVALVALYLLVAVVEGAVVEADNLRKLAAANNHVVLEPELEHLAKVEEVSAPRLALLLESLPHAGLEGLGHYLADRVVQLLGKVILALPAGQGKDVVGQQLGESVAHSQSMRDLEVGEADESLLELTVDHLPLAIRLSDSAAGRRVDLHKDAIDLCQVQLVVWQSTVFGKLPKVDHLHRKRVLHLLLLAVGHLRRDARAASLRCGFKASQGLGFFYLRVGAENLLQLRRVLHKQILDLSQLELRVAVILEKVGDVEDEVMRGALDLLVRQLVLGYTARVRSSIRIQVLAEAILVVLVPSSLIDGSICVFKSSLPVSLPLLELTHVSVERLEVDAVRSLHDPDVLPLPMLLPVLPFPRVDLV